MKQVFWRRYIQDSYRNHIHHIFHIRFAATHQSSDEASSNIVHAGETLLESFLLK